MFLEPVDEDGSPLPMPVRVLASTMRRSAETATFVGHQPHVEQLSSLNPLEKGDFAGMELEELQVENPIAHNNLGYTLLGLGLVLERHGLRDEAIAAFQTAVDIRPDYTNAVENLERLKGVRGRE